MSNVDVIFEISLPSCSIKLKEEEARALYAKLKSILEPTYSFTEVHPYIYPQISPYGTACSITVRAQKND